MDKVCVLSAENKTNNKSIKDYQNFSANDLKDQFIRMNKTLKVRTI